MAETITIVIPDGYESEMLDAFAEQQDFSGTYEEKKAFLEDFIKNLLNEMLVEKLRARAVIDAERKLEEAQRALRSAQSEDIPSIL